MTGNKIDGLGCDDLLAMRSRLVSLFSSASDKAEENFNCASIAMPAITAAAQTVLALVEIDRYLAERQGHKPK